MKKIIVDPGLIDSLEVGDAVMDWDREKSSVTDEDGNVVGYIDLNDGKMIHVWLYEDGESGHSPDAAYDFERHEWNPQCPHGDICTGCDARGYCTRMEDRDPRRRRVSGLPERPAIASEGRQATLCPYVTSGTGAKTPLNCVYEKGHAGEHVYA